MISQALLGQFTHLRQEFCDLHALIQVILEEGALLQERLRFFETVDVDEGEIASTLPVLAAKQAEQ
jgi:hypothetical protein